MILIGTKVALMMEYMFSKKADIIQEINNQKKKTLEVSLHFQIYLMIFILTLNPVDS